MPRHFKGFNSHPPPKKWWRFRAICIQCLIPIIIFQLLRTFLFPTTIDVVLITLLIVLFCCLKFDIF